MNEMIFIIVTFVIYLIIACTIDILLYSNLLKRVKFIEKTVLKYLLENYIKESMGYKDENKDE